MTAPTTTPDVERYLAGVRTALADLDAVDRDDLLEDLQGHLEELRAEDPAVDLEQRLGAPAPYAAELRQSAGLPLRDLQARLTLAERLDRTRAALGQLLRSWPGGRAVLDFLPELRPAWWVLRAYGVLAIADRLLHHDKAYRWGGTLLPSVHGNKVLGAALLLVLAIVSVRLGKAASGSFTAPRRVLLGLANVALLVATPAYFVGLSQSHLENFTAVPCCGTLFGSDGHAVSNVFAYDENGKPISRVQLFDQDGLPLDVLTNDQTGSEQLHNVFPQREVGVTTTASDGTYTEIPKAPPVVLAPLLPPSPSPTPTPNLNPTPTRAPASSPSPSR